MMKYLLILALVVIAYLFYYRGVRVIGPAWKSDAKAMRSGRSALTPAIAIS